MKVFLKSMASPPTCMAVLVGLGLMTAGSANAQAAGNCGLSLSESVIDLGLAARSDSSRATGDKAGLGKRTVLLTITCNSPEDLSLQFHAAASGSDGFQLVGSSNAMYTVTATRAVLDGEGVSLGIVDSSGETTSVVAQSQRFYPGRRVVPIVAGLPASGTSLSMTLEIEAWAGARSLRVADAAQWRSSGLIEALDGTISSDLEISASVDPVACTASLDKGGVIDLGKIPPGGLHETNVTVLPARQLGFTITCDNPASFALSLIDERGGSSLSGATGRYGLGVDSAGGKIGEYEVVVDPARTTVVGLGGTTPRVLVTESPDNGVSWLISSSQPTRLTGNLLGFTDIATSNTGAQPWQMLSTAFDVNVTIAPLVTLARHEAINVDGAARLLITYL